MKKIIKLFMENCGEIFSSDTTSIICLLNKKGDILDMNSTFVELAGGKSGINMKDFLVSSSYRQFLSLLSCKSKRKVILNFHFNIMDLPLSYNCRIIPVENEGIIFYGETVPPLDQKAVTQYLKVTNDLAAITRDLQKSRHEVKVLYKELEKYQNHLEKMVEERTRELKLANKKLEKEVVCRKKAEEEIKASLEEKEVLLKEVHHRVKNNLQIITSLLNLQSRSIKDDKITFVFRESQDRIHSMALVHEILYQAGDFSKIDFSGYVKRLTYYLFRAFGINSDKIMPVMKVEEVFLDIDRAIPCGLIINELVSNALKYAFPGDKSGSVIVSFCLENSENFVLVVRDDGVGLPDDFDLNDVPTLGLQLVVNLVEQIDGTIEFSRLEGTEFKITFLM